MPKIAYTPKKFRAEALAIIAQVNAIEGRIPRAGVRSDAAPGLLSVRVARLHGKQ